MNTGTYVFKHKKTFALNDGVNFDILINSCDDPHAGGTFTLSLRGSILVWLLESEMF